jgi:hypothetical protein
MLGIGLLLVGCAGTQPSRSVDADTHYLAVAPPTVSAPATALVFDPPVTAYTPAELDLDRNARMAGAYVGFESSVTYSSTTFDDRQFYTDARGGGGRYGRVGSGSGYVDRQAVSQTFGVRQR